MLCGIDHLSKMPKLPMPPSTVRPHWVRGSWLTESGRYVEYARRCVSDLEKLVVEVNDRWPGPLGTSIKQEDADPELWELAHRRDMNSDSVKVYAAMAVEAFANFYGVVRLTQPVFDAAYERLPLVDKLKVLLRHCDGLSLTKSSLLLMAATRISTRRNDLVHPKAKETSGPPTANEKAGELIPQGAQEAFADMMTVFKEFAAAVPEGSILLPDDVRRELGLIST
jgi:hypothetical protein